MNPLVRNLLVTAVALLILMRVVFTVAMSRGTHRIIDAVWGGAFALVALISLLMSTGNGQLSRRLLITVLTAAWGVRLSVYIGQRGRGAPEDPRYAALLAKANGRDPAWYAFSRIYLLQGVLIWFVSLPIQVGQYDARALSGATTQATLVAGCLLWIIGLYFEAVGDRQLAQFKANPANRGRLLTTGLRRYTRHPNYFGDACVWWGLFLLGADRWLGLATVLSPLVMTWLLTSGSGRPLMDGHLARTRPEYAEYAARTSGFLPRRPKGPREPRQPKHLSG